MPKGLRIKHSSKGMQELMSSPEFVADLETRTFAVAAAAGTVEEFDAEVTVVGGSSKLGRAMGYVRTASYEGRRKAAEDQALIRALDAGR